MDVAVRTLERAVKTDPNDREARKRLILAYLRVGQFCVDETPEGFILYNLPYRNMRINVLWSKRTKTLTLDELKPTRRIADLPLYVSTIIALYLYRDGAQSVLIQQILALFASDFESDYVRTASAIDYSPSELDIIHHWPIIGKFQSISMDVFIPRVTGVPPRWTIKANTPYDDLLQALLQTNDIRLFIEAYRAITGQPLRLLISRAKTVEAETRAIVIGGGAPGSGGHDISCIDEPPHRRTVREASVYIPED